MQEIIVATNNKHKLDEIREILKDTYVVKSLKDIGLNIEVEEDGRTFYENALKKAQAVAQLTGRAALADDSGLVVSALGGAPGVYSARFAGESSTDAQNNQKLLKCLKGVNERSAYFMCAIVLYFPNGSEIAAEGRAYGCILHQERGASGFGYDPLFLSNDLNKTFAEATPAEKNLVSHRSRALADLKTKLNF
ncbi:MAG: XTP/dITP diphosphatase [Clostridia bacterium]